MYCFRATIYRFFFLFTRSVSYSEGSHASLFNRSPLTTVYSGRWFALLLYVQFQFIYLPKKKQQVLFKCGESAKVLSQCPLELLPFGNVLLNPALNI